MRARCACARGAAQPTTRRGLGARALRDKVAGTHEHACAPVGRCAPLNLGSGDDSTFPLRLDRKVAERARWDQVAHRAVVSHLRTVRRRTVRTRARTARVGMGCSASGGRGVRRRRAASRAAPPLRRGAHVATSPFNARALGVGGGALLGREQRDARCAPPRRAHAAGRGRRGQMSGARHATANGRRRAMRRARAPSAPSTATTSARESPTFATHSAPPRSSATMAHVPASSLLLA